MKKIKYSSLYNKAADNNFAHECDNKIALNYFSQQFLLDKEDEQSREKVLEFRAANNDYFGTLATVLDLMSQEKGEFTNINREILKKIRDDLIYLQNNYKLKRNN